MALRDAVTRSGTWRLFLRAFEVCFFIALLPARLGRAATGPKLFKELGPLKQVLRHLRNGLARVAPVPSAFCVILGMPLGAVTSGRTGNPIRTSANGRIGDVIVVEIFGIAVARRVAVAPTAGDGRGVGGLRGLGFRGAGFGARNRG